MNLNNCTPDKWYNKYEAMPEQEQYDFLKETLELVLTVDFVQDIELIDIIISMFEYLIEQNNMIKFWSCKLSYTS